MGEFRIYAKIGGLISGETPEAAQRHAQQILTQLLEPKGFDVVGVAAVAGDKIPGRLATVEQNEAANSTMQVLRWLQKNVFSEEIRLSSPRKKKVMDFLLTQYPLTVTVPQSSRGPELEATGMISEAPAVLTHDYTPSKDDIEKYGIKYKSTGAHMPVPEGRFGYAWEVHSVFPPNDVIGLQSGERRLIAEIEGVVKHKLDGSILNVKSVRQSDEPGPADIDMDTVEDASPPDVRYKSVMTTDPNTDELKLTLAGVFHSPIPPEELDKHMTEKIGIRSMLPKEVAETNPEEKPAAEPMAEKHDLSKLLGSLLK